MFIIPTKRIKTEVAFSTATSRAGNSRAELENVGQRAGFRDRILSVEEIRKMSSTEYLWFSEFFPNRLEEAEQRSENKQAYEQAAQQNLRRAKWDNKAPVTDDERKEMKEAAEQFRRLYPQYIWSESNGKTLWDYMSKENMDPTKLSEIERAFQELVQDGKLALNPSAIAAGQESSVSGEQLTSHHNFHALLQRHRRPTPEESMSAEEWKKSRPELQDNRIPPMIARRIAQQQATNEFFKQAESSTNRSRATVITDYKGGNDGKH